MISDGSVLNRIYFVHAWRGVLPRMAWPATAESTAIYRASTGGCRIDFRSERTKHTPVHALPAFRASLIILLHGYRECSCSWNKPWSERHSILEKSWFIRSKTQSPLDRQALGHSFSRCPLSFFLFLFLFPERSKLEFFEGATASSPEGKTLATTAEMPRRRRQKDGLECFRVRTIPVGI